MLSGSVNDRRSGIKAHTVAQLDLDKVPRCIFLISQCNFPCLILLINFFFFCYTEHGVQVVFFKDPTENNRIVERSQ